jgi:ATP phosphoribosyltransferase
MSNEVVNTLALPASVLAEVESVAVAERRSVADMICDLVESGLGLRRARLHAEREWQRARVLGLADDEGPVTENDVQTIREKIRLGMASSRSGRLVDGESVFVRMEAELASPDRQGQG